MATEAIASQAIENLLRKNQVPHFHLLILDALNQKEELDRYTRAQLQKIVNKQLPQNSQKLINETLEFVAKQAIKLRQETQKQIDQQRLQLTQPIKVQLNLLQTNAVLLLELKDLVTDSFTLYTTQSILKQLTKTLQLGWTQMNLQSAWRQTMQLRHRPAPQTQSTMKTPAKRTPRTPNPKSRTKQKPTQTKVTITPPTLKAEKQTGPVEQREQAPKPIGTHAGKITGTDIPFKAGKCNNWQVWSSCELLNTPRGCKWDHSCSNCGSKLHGAGACPYK